MPRPKETTTLPPDKASGVYCYFERLFERKYDVIDTWGQALHEAERQFNELGFPVNTSDVALLSDWLDRYVPDVFWRKCNTALRQRRYKAKHKTVTTRLSRDVYLDVMRYAAQKDLTIQDAIRDAIQIATQHNR